MPVVLIILGMIVPTAAAAQEGQTRDRLPGDLLGRGRTSPSWVFKGREAIVAVDGPDE
jgi:hypothetical protein